MTTLISILPASEAVALANHGPGMLRLTWKGPLWHDPGMIPLHECIMGEGGIITALHEMPDGSLVPENTTVTLEHDAGTAIEIRCGRPGWNQIRP